MSKRHRLNNYITREFEVYIDDINSRGWGRGEIEDEGRRVPVEVRGAFPGDRVRVVGRHIEDSRVQCGIVEFLEKKYPRIEIGCPHACVRCDKDTGCGGCTLRELSYETQCDVKQGILERLLAKSGVKTPVSPILPCLTQDFYRNKMELSFGPDGADELGTGLHPSGFKYEVIQMKYCDTFSEIIAELAQKTTAWAKALGVRHYVFKENSGFLRLLTLREGKRTGARMVILTTSGEDALDVHGEMWPAERVVMDYAEKVLGTLSQKVDTFYWTAVTTQKGHVTRNDDHLMFGPAVLRERMLMPDEAHALEYEILPRAFFQPNTLQAERLYQVVLNQAAPYMTPEMPMLDLYCGTGTIALSFARYGHRAIAVDIEKQAIENARENARKNGLEDRIEFYAGDTADILKQLLDADANFGDYLMVVDPPRRGLLPPAYRQILRIQLKTIIYVSCNPESLAEDLRRFEDDGYDVVNIQPVDMLPQTAHLETVATLRRRG
ncbi:MAG: 23S rRNA (uracil(1939)-C(5))-methyltransferase RlmD [Proteobacteria bacterium]|nr:23S rRNA (uracil(1939)-C(5))-methyltransferase RlmD [Pseudomonadota bacterium]